MPDPAWLLLREKTSLIPSPTSTTPVARSTHLATARILSLIASCETTSATSAYQPNKAFPNLLVLGGGALELPG